MKSAVILVRVSSLVQDFNAQKSDLEDFATKEGYTNLHFIETKESGFNDFENRVGATKLFEFLDENPDFKTVIITELSRLSRRMTVLSQFKDIFVKRGIQLIVKDSNIKLLNENGQEDPNGSLMFYLFGVFAESEMKAKKDRFLRSRKDLMAQGLSISGPVLFGYQKKKETKNSPSRHVKDPNNSEIVRRLFDWYLNGFDSSNKNPSIKLLAQHCISKNYPKYTHSKRNLNKMLKEQAYTGVKTTDSGYKILYPMIIEQPIFESVQKKMASKKALSRNNKNTTILAGIIECPSCKRKLSANYRESRQGNNSPHSYRCTSRTDAQGCDFKSSVSMSLIDSSIWSLVKTDYKEVYDLMNELNPSEQIVEHERRKSHLEQEISDCDEKINKTKEILISFSSFKKMPTSAEIQDLTNKIHKLTKTQSKLDKEHRTVMKEINVLESFSNPDENYEGFLNRLAEIENSAQLIKKYINHLVSSIQIVHHDKTSSILLVHFRSFRAINDYRANNVTNALDASNYLKKTILFIDKNNTINPKLYKSNKLIKRDLNDYSELIKKDLVLMKRIANKSANLNEYTNQIIFTRLIDFYRRTA
jgi:DNA invertase Pin-like site-specific DNA recombinase